MLQRQTYGFFVIQNNVRDAGHESWVMPVHHGEEKEIALLQIMLDAVDDLRAVIVADLRGNHTDSKGSLEPQRAGKKVGAVIKFAGGLQNALFSVFGYGSSRCRIVQCCRDGSWRQAQTFADSFQCDFLECFLLVRSCHPAVLCGPSPIRVCVHFRFCVAISTKSRFRRGYRNKISKMTPFGLNLTASELPRVR